MFSFAVYQIAFIVAIGGFVCGWDIGIISGNLASIAKDFDLSPVQEGSVVSVLFAGAIIGAILGGYLSDRIGRLRSIHVQNLMYLSGGICLTLAQSLNALLFGRFVMGVGTTMSSTCEVPYLCEVTDARSRGFFGSIYEVMVTMGVLASYVCNFSMYGKRDSWRIGFALPAVFAIVQSLLLLGCPESPKWLMKQGRMQEAADIYKRIFGSAHTLDQVQPDVSSLREVSILAPGETENPSRGAKVGKVLSNALEFVKKFQRPLCVCFLLNIFSQFTGGTTVRVYAPTIFQAAGISVKTALIYNIVLGFIKFIVVLVSVRIVDSTGRQKLLTIGNILIGIGLLLLTVAFSVDGDNINSVAFLIGCAFCMGGYSASWGPVLYLCCSEMFPVEIRGRALSLSMIVQNIAQLLATLAFLPLINSWGASLVFAGMLILVVVTGAFIVLGFVETSGKENTQIMADLKQQHALLNWDSLRDMFIRDYERRCPTKTQVKLDPSPVADFSSHIAEDDIPSPLFSTTPEIRRL